jgi:hypothetical protein
LSDRTKEVFALTGNDLSTVLRLLYPESFSEAEENFKLKVSILAEANATLTTDGKRNVLISAKTVSIDPSLGVEVGYTVIYIRGGLAISNA